MFEYAIDKNIKIIYNECDQEYIGEVINYFKENYVKIMQFFNINQLDKKMIIKLWDDANLFRKKLSDITGYEYPLWATGSSKNDQEDPYSRIDYLSLCEIKKIEYHKDYMIGDLKKGIMHEFTHTCHTQFCNYNFPEETYLTEGVATFLANQYENAKLTEPLEKVFSEEEYVEYQNYRYIFNLLVERYSHEDLLLILSNGAKIDKTKFSM